jgi:PAS domain S-box-containing protein
MDAEKRKSRPIPKGRARKQDNASREVRPTDRTDLEQRSVGLRPDLEFLRRETQERERVEAALKRTERDYRHLVECAHDAILIFRPEDEVVLEVNQRACELYGFGRSEFIGMSLEKITHDVPRGKVQIQATLDQGFYHHFESVHYRKGGSKMFVEINGSRVNYQGQWAIQSINRDITERKRAEEALRDSESHYRTLVEQSLQGILIAQGFPPRIVFANPAMAEILGYSPDELTSLSPEEIWRLLSPEDQSRFEQRYRNRTAGRSVSPRYEFRLLRNDHSVCWVDMLISPTTFQGAPAFQAVCMDITKRKRAEEALRESEKRYRNLVETAPDVIYSLAEDGTIASLNPAFEAITGWPCSEWLGKPFMGLIHPGDLPLAVETFEQALKGTAPPPYELRVLSKSGEYLVGEFTSMPRVEKGKVVGEFGIVRNITDRKRAEEALHREHDLIRRITETSPAGVTVVNREGQITFANARAEQVLGLAKDEITQRTYNAPAWRITDYSGNPFPDEEFPFRRVMASGQPIYDVQHAIEWPDGRRVLLSINASPLFDEKGQADGMVATVEDVTERKRAEEALKDSEEKYRLLVQNSRQSILVLQDGLMKFANTRAIEYSGYSEEELTSTPFLNLVHSDDRSMVAERYQKRLKGEEIPHIYQFRFLDKQRQAKWVEVNSVLIAWKGRPAALSFLSDITDRRRAEEALRESEGRYRLLAENVSDVIWMMDLSLNFTYVSPSVTRLRGYSVEEAKSLSLKETLTPASFERAMHVFSEEMALEGSGRADPLRFRTLELENVCKDGSVVWTEVTTTFLRDPNGRPSGILGVSREITERKRAEEALRESEAMSRAVLEHSPVGISIRDHKGVLLQVNEAWKKIWAISDAEIQENEKWSAGRSWKERCPYLGDSGQDLDRLFTPECGVSILYLPELEIPEPRPGAAQCISLYLYALRNQDGRVEKVVALTQDITERQRSEEALRRSEEHFRVLIENSSDFILVVDEKGIVTYVSPSVERYIGYKPEELIGESGFKFIALADLPRAVIDFGKAILITGSIIPNAFRVRHKDGSERILEGVGRSLFDNPAVAGFVMNVRDVTERRKAEEALRKNEAKYRELVENANSIILRRDPEGRITFFNEFAQRFFGFREEEILGRHVVGTIVPEKESSGRDLAQMIRDISRHPERYATNENENVLRNGERVWVAWTNKPILDPDGKLAEILCIGNDITERKRAEERLAESEVKYRTLVEGMSEAVMQVDNDDRVQFVNPQFCQMIGYGEDELLGRVGYEIYFDPEEQELIRRKNRLRKEKIFDAYETRMRKKTGEEVLVRISGSPVTDAQGNVVGSIGVITDITERKRAEQTVKESETKYRGIVDHSLLGIYITQGPIMRFCNQRLAEIFGYERPEELLGINVRELVAPESWEAVETQVQRRESGELDTVRYEFKGKRRDGALIDLEVLGGRILYEGKPAIQGSMIEVTERKLLEAEFLQAQKMEALGRLAGGVAHDFNNLLTSIMGYSDLLAKKLTEDDPSGPLRRYADSILSSANRAANLTQQLLSLSRRHAFQMQILDLNVVVAEVERILRGLIGEDIELTTHAEGALGRVKADSVQIEQVLMNLVINARDAMPRGGRLSIRTANVVLDKSYARRRREVIPGPYVMIAVTDTGQGMDAEVQSHLFEPFFTTKEKGKGTGLGLSTAYSIVKQTGGHIVVESAPGKGSAFKIYLPRTEEPPAPLASSQPRSVEAELPRGVETVLLAEDEEIVRSLAREVLRSAGYTVLEADNGEEALRVAGSHPGPIHLLLTDVIMPRLGGPELARRLQPLRPDMKVLFMSGYTDGDISSYGGLGSEPSLLQKPFQPIVLARRVREVLEAP